MANKELYSINVNSEAIKNAIQETGTSIRRLSKEVGVGDRTIRSYLERGRMPPFLLSKICKAIEVTPSSVICGKTLWMRIGVTVPVTDDELDDLLRESMDASYSKTSFEDVDLEEGSALKYLQRAVLDGESYIPGCCFDKYEGMVYAK